MLHGPTFEVPIMVPAWLPHGFTHIHSCAVRPPLCPQNRDSLIPRAIFLDPVGAVMMPRYAREEKYFGISQVTNMPHLTELRSGAYRRDLNRWRGGRHSGREVWMALIRVL